MSNENGIKVEDDVAVSSFSISKYIVYTILPKCTMVFGEAITTTYLQIALNINHEQEVQSWKKNKSWIGLKTISNTTGFNFRKIDNSVKDLIYLGLLKQSNRGKLKLFELKNNNIFDCEVMLSFIESVEEKLIDFLKPEKKIAYREKFDQLNKAISLYESTELFSKKIWIPDIGNLRSSILQAEYFYKGSSLFYINLIHQKSPFKKSCDETDNILHEKDLYLLLGCSPTTINRYLQSYQEANLVINKELQINTNPINVQKGVVNVEMEQEKYICPICKREFNTIRSFNLHLTKQTGEKHKYLNTLRRIKYTSIYEETLELYEQNKEKIDELHEEIEEVFTEEVEKTKKQAVGYDMIPDKKVAHEDTAPGLLKYFYDLTGGKSPSFAKECRQIKMALESKETELTPDQLRTILKFMARKSYEDIRFLKTSINEALLEQDYLNQTNVEGTAPYLLKYFYNGHGLDINLQTFIREVRKIQETINSGLSYGDTKTVIDYMIKTKCTTINFIGSKRTDALTGKDSKDNFKSQGQNSTFKSNPSFFDQDFLNIFRDELISGRANLRKVQADQKEAAKTLARQVFVEHKFTNRYTGFEWAWRTGLELDKETYNLGCKELGKTTHIDAAINSGKLNEDQLNTYQRLKAKFEAWLQQQHSNFQDSQISQ